MTQVIVETATGSLRGLREGAISVFRGIPFGRPPVGPGRFRPPVPAGPWTGVRDAVTFAPACPQLPQQPEWNIPVAAWDLRAEMDEDCLHLNLWTPAIDGASRPVLVWIHGGGMEFGAGSQVWFDAGSLARRADAVVVTINYRLGALGWLYLDELGEEIESLLGNAGLHDQTLALRWVQENIAVFGGDPARVTVAGRSAGAITVTSLLAAPEARGLFQQAAVISGAAETDLPSEALRLGHLVLAELGIELDRASRLWDVPASEIVYASRIAVTKKPTPQKPDVGRFLPVIDGETVPEHPHSAVRSGSSRDVTLLITTTANEGGLWPIVFDEGGDDGVVSKLVGLLPETDPSIAHRIVEAYRPLFERASGGVDFSALFHAIKTDLQVGVPALRLAQAQVSAGGQAFLGIFAHRSPDPARGAYHGIDVGFMFDTLDVPGMAALSGEGGEVGALRDAIIASWTAFLWRGLPDLGDVPWAAFEMSNETVMLLDHPCRPATAGLRALREVWTGVI